MQTNEGIGIVELFSHVYNEEDLERIVDRSSECSKQRHSEYARVRE